VKDDGKEVTMLLDHLRGSRGLPNSKTMLSKLVSDSRGNFQLYLYHTPNLRGLVKRYFPERFNEGFGLQHMKLFVFDNDVILTGLAHTSLRLIIVHGVCVFYVINSFVGQT